MRCCGPNTDQAVGSVANRIVAGKEQLGPDTQLLGLDLPPNNPWLHGTGGLLLSSRAFSAAPHPLPSSLAPSPAPSLAPSLGNIFRAAPDLRHHPSRATGVFTITRSDIFTTICGREATLKMTMEVVCKLHFRCRRRPPARPARLPVRPPARPPLLTPPS